MRICRSDPVRALMEATVLWGVMVLPAAAAEEIIAPSGQHVEWQETRQDAPGPDGLTMRFRFIAPDIDGKVDTDTALNDMQWLCDSWALPRIASTGPQPAQVIISLAAREVPFGVASDDTTQYFEAFRPEGGRCIWEIY
jgi:hypothetical protein